MWRFITKRSPILRAIAVVATVGTLVTSVTYATLQAPAATLSGNTISTASASLLVGTASATSTSFAASKTGFTFSNIVPGGGQTPADGNTFYLRNNGTATLDVKFGVGSTPTNPGNVDLNKVTVILTRVDTGTSQSATLQSLIDGYASGGLALTDEVAPTTNSNAIQYKLAVSMAADAFTGASASIGGIDFVFNGSAALPAQS